MIIQKRPTLKALNIVRPSSPFPLQDTSHSSSTASNSTLSTLSNNSFTKVQPTILSPANFAYFQNNWSTFKTNPIGNTVGVNPHRFLQRPRSNSNLSRATFMSNHSILSSKTNDEDDDDDEMEVEENDLDTIDGLTDDEDENEQEDQDSDEEDNTEEDETDDYDYDYDEDDEEEEDILPSKVVAKIKHGIIMNGKGEFVNKGSVEDQPLDEARANRKIADLEIEKASLLALNMTLEAKLKVQATQIEDLQKRLQVNDGPLTPVSDKHVDEPLLFDSPIDTEEQLIEQDEVFHRIRNMLEGLIKQAEEALIQKSKVSGKVLKDYVPNEKNESKPENIQTRPLARLKARASTPDMRRPRNMSDSERPQPKPSIAKNTRTPSPSRQSSPPILVTSPTTPRSPSPRASLVSNNSRTLRHMRKSQEFEKPKWHF
ncbi:hypothetical protein K501DRAFT_332648 [Backusella circina FSU 941]|nr:hypothetical protein K501DRAFT_332648 [Backusella circina FSU 941]